MKKNTLNALKESIASSEKLKNHLINNCSSKEKHVFTFNLVSVDYNFEKSSVLIEYYVEDNNYPTIEINFDLFIVLLKKSDWITNNSLLNKLHLFVLTFIQRLSDNELKLVLDYIEYNESTLALETLCDYICENNIAITQAEYNQIIEFNNLQKSKPHKLTHNYLKKCILK